MPQLEPRTAGLNEWDQVGDAELNDTKSIDIYACAHGKARTIDIMDTLPNFFAQMLLTGTNKGSFELTKSLLHMPKEIATVQVTPGWPKLVLRAKWASDGEEYKNPCSSFYTEGK